MADFLWKRVSEKEKEDIRKQAKEIMDDFSKKLSKVDKKVDESLIERNEGEREEAPLGVPQSAEFGGKAESKCENDFSREIMFKNASKKNKDFIIAERKKW